MILRTMAARWASLAAIFCMAWTVHSAEPVFTQTTVFESGKDGYAMYRIPGLVVTERGTLLAYAEARKNGGADWGHIDLVLRRSTDGGATWSKPTLLAQQGPGFEKNPLAPKGKGEAGITFNNPVAIVDGKIVHLLYCVEYMRCFYTRSEDDGQTFAKPVEITATFNAFRKQYDWKVLATGPGHGVRLSKTGRLIVPVWLSTGNGGNAHRPSCVGTIISDDQGKTWQAGSIVVNHPELSNPSETAAVERADGTVLLNIRHEGPTFRRASCFSTDGATQWSKIAHEADLPEPVCMGSLARGPGKRLLFTNPHNTAGRERRTVTVHASDDDGRTWPIRRAIESGLSGYSDLAVAPDGTMYCLYERAGGGANPGAIRSLILATFNSTWLNTKPIRIVALGDSITKGFRPGVHDEETFASRTEAQLRRTGLAVEIINVGIGGENTAQAKARLKAAVLDQRPDHVLIMYGANDSYIDKGKTEPRISVKDYKANLTSMVRDLHAAKIRPILMTTNRYSAGHAPDGSGQHPNRMMDAYMQACREVATELNVLLIDHQQRWIDKEKQGTDLAKWMTDHVHPNATGHAELADALAPVLRDLFRR